MVLWKQDSNTLSYAKGGDTLEECRDYVFGVKHLSRPFSWNGVPTYAYEFKNGTHFRLPILRDYINKSTYDYRVERIEFAARRRIVIFGPRCI